ncbi:hypothetical protein AVEN_237479-1 [Araneus ventricosus]|uniref:Uncharacterized protein n=1 Tax=Araneus ventricosus TaxID=182803 RepID=A0A4Y2F8X9_ARAVE|nr:hypothetical protein AVEN_237479-1 [Araneus ventricosus]
MPNLPRLEVDERTDFGNFDILSEDIVFGKVFKFVRKGCFRNGCQSCQNLKLMNVQVSTTLTSFSEKFADLVKKMKNKVGIGADFHDKEVWKWSLSGDDHL